MELIPILSLIVLVATMSTFILAVGAYVMYKIRERKGRVSQAPQPAAIEAELITPASAFASQRETDQLTRMTHVTEQMQTRVTEPGYQRQQARMTAPARRTITPPMRPTFIGNTPETRYTEERFVPRQTTEKTSQKFMRYTSDGYVEPKKDEQKEKKQEKKEDRLRWR